MNVVSSLCVLCKRLLINFDKWRKKLIVMITISSKISCIDEQRKERRNAARFLEFSNKKNTEQNLGRKENVFRNQSTISGKNWSRVKNSRIHLNYPK